MPSASVTERVGEHLVRQVGFAKTTKEAPLKITASALSLNVEDPTTSASFAKEHLGFTEDMTGDGFVALSRADAGFNLIYLRTGLETFKPESLRGKAADGLLVVFVVEDIDDEYARLQQEGVEITTPIETEPWGSGSSR